MEQTTPENFSGRNKRLSVTYLLSRMSLCAKQTRRVTRNLKSKASRKIHQHCSPKDLAAKLTGRKKCGGAEAGREEDYGGGGRSKEILKTISGKAKALVRRKKAGCGGGKAEKEEEEHGGVWQKAILMGDRCQPLDFTGVIYYDCDGRQLKEPPARSPRRSPLPSYLV